MRAVLFTNKNKDTDGIVRKSVMGILNDSGLECSVYNGDADIFNGAYAAVSIGGDGTFLRCAKYAVPRGVAVIGVHMGHTGYLSHINPDKLELLRGIASFNVCERSVLVSEGKIAVNDIVFSRGTEIQAISLELEADGQPLGSFLGDGVIISSATGSTGYALSAGGPVVDPAIGAMVVTPVCAHTSRAHSFVIAPGRVLTVAPSNTERRPVYLTADGGETRKMEPGERVEVRISKQPLRCLEPDGHSFFQKVRIHRL
jgi:NAD+ kinase